MQTVSSPRNQPSGQSSSTPGTRPHQCAFCRKRFTKPEHLCRHLRIHTGSKPFECAKCHKRFSRQDTLSRHMRVHIDAHAAEDAVQPALQVPGFHNSSDGGATLFEGLDLLTPPDVTGVASGLELHPSGSCLPTYMDLHGCADPFIPDFEFWSDLAVDKPSPTRPALSLGSHRSSKLADGDDEPSTQESRAIHDVALSIRQMSESLISDVSSLIADTLYLETCIHMFFARFIPAIPAIHIPTYTATKPAYPLMLTMMAVGSLFVAEDEASLAKGEFLWRLVEQRFLTSVIGQAGTRPIDGSIMTVTFLGQCYALLSGKKHLQEAGLTCTATAFHQIRRGTLYQSACRPHSPPIPSSDSSSSHSSEEKEQRWKTWASEETLRRSILGYYIVDGLMADLLGQPTTIHHIGNILPVPSADALFYAATADEWFAELRSQEADAEAGDGDGDGDGGVDEELTFEELYEALFAGRDLHRGGRPLSYLAVRVVLEGLHSCVGEIRSRSRGGRRVPRHIPSEGELYGVLVRLREGHIMRLSAEEKLEHEIRWHVVCINLVIDLSVLQQQLSRPLREEREDSVGARAESVNLRCALLHATAILTLCQQLPFGRSHCMHIPSALFAAASVCMGVLRCLCVRGDEKQGLWVPGVGDWDEVRRVVYEGERSGASSVAGFATCSMAELVGRMPRRDLSRDVATMQGLLRQLSVHMGLSREFGRTIMEWFGCLRSV